MVGTAGIEPATPTMSTWCSPAELRTHFLIQYIQWEEIQFKVLFEKNERLYAVTEA